MDERRKPGQIRDAILEALGGGQVRSCRDIHAAVSTKLGTVSESSVRSYLNINTPAVFERVGHGRYRLRGRP